jgi:hypothetical protein
LKTLTGAILLKKSFSEAYPEMTPLEKMRMMMS